MKSVEIEVSNGKQNIQMYKRTKISMKIFEKQGRRKIPKSILNINK